MLRSLSALPDCVLVAVALCCLKPALKALYCTGKAVNECCNSISDVVLEREIARIRAEMKMWDEIAKRNMEEWRAMPKPVGDPFA